MVDHQAIPYCIPCGYFHEESTCQVFLQILSEKMAEKTENEQVNMCGKKYNIDMYDWMDLVESCNIPNTDIFYFYAKLLK